jgi:hypothetical protein
VGILEILRQWREKRVLRKKVEGMKFVFEVCKAGKLQL